MTHPPTARRPTTHRGLAALALGGILLGAAPAGAVDQPSAYPGCATRELRVPWGGAATVDLRECQAFGLGTVASPPAHGSATPGDGEPVESYTYSHAGRTPAGGGDDHFVVLDDNSDRISVRVTIDPPDGAAGAAIGITPEALPALRVGMALRQPLSADGGQAPFAWSLEAGALPAGVSLGREGVLAGTPSARGPYAFTLAVRDAGGATARRSFGGEVAAGELRLRATRADVSPGQPFSLALAAEGGVPPYRFLAEVPAQWPAGVSLSADGVLSGLAAGPARAWPLSVRVTDASPGAGAYFALLDFTLVVGRVPTVTLRAPVAAVAEDEGAGLVFVVSRDEALATPTTVLLQASGDARLAGGRAGGRWRVAIPAGAREATVTVRPLADAMPEADRTLEFTLVPAGGYVVGTPARAAATLVDDDLP